MAKLHEVLAVEGDLEGTFKKLSLETHKTFSKPALFTGMHKTCEMFNEGDIAPPDEHQEMTTTVREKLEYLAKAGVKYFNTVFSKDATNCVASANVEVDGKVLLENVPATFLLGLENKLKKLREVYESIPTLQQGIKWEKDETLGEGVYVSVHPDVKLKTAKQFKHQVLYEATEKHPAQIEKWEEQVPVGQYITNIHSGMFTPARKSEVLGKIDKLIQAVKKARQRANTTELVKRDVGNTIFDYING